MTETTAVIEIRRASPADAPAIARVHVATWRETYAGLLPDDLLANLSVERREAQWAAQIAASGAPGDLNRVVVATLEGCGVVGFASCGPEREPESGFDAELYTIYLLAEYHGRGIGRELFLRACEEAVAVGFRSLRLWVLEGNPTAGFYAHLGGEPVGRKGLVLGDGSYLEAAFGWRDLLTMRGARIPHSNHE